MGFWFKIPSSPRDKRGFAETGAAETSFPAKRDFPPAFPLRRSKTTAGWLSRIWNVAAAKRLVRRWRGGAKNHSWDRFQILSLPLQCNPEWWIRLKVTPDFPCLAVFLDLNSSKAIPIFLFLRIAIETHPVLYPAEIKIINWYLSKFLLDSNLFFSLFSLYRIIKRIKEKLHGR